MAVIEALSADQVAKVTGLSVGQLSAWDRRGFFQPQYAYDNRHAAYSRIYSFKDVVGLKTIAMLRSKYKIGFRKLREVADRLSERGIDHWADTTLYVLKRDVHFRNPLSGEVESLSSGQLAIVEVVEVIEDVRQKVEALKHRMAAQIGSIERNKFVARNSWVVSGTRIPTATIKRYYDAGYSVEQIVEEYPTLTSADVMAAVSHEEVLEKSA